MMMMMMMDDDDDNDDDDDDGWWCSTPKKLVLRQPLQFELEFGHAGFRGEEKTGVPGKNLS